MHSQNICQLKARTICTVMEVKSVYVILISA